MKAIYGVPPPQQQLQPATQPYSPTAPPEYNNQPPPPFTPNPDNDTGERTVPNVPDDGGRN